MSGEQPKNQETEKPTVFVRESRSCIGLTNDINQTSCVDSAFEFKLLLPRVYLPTSQHDLKVKCLSFIGTCHFMVPMILKFLFDKMPSENFRSWKKKSSYLDFCYTSTLESWSELDDYYAKINRIIKLDNALNSIDSIETYLYRAKNYIINPILTEIKNHKYDSKMLGLICLTLSFEGDVNLTGAGFTGFRLLTRKKLRELAMKKQTIKYIRKSSNREISVSQVSKALLSFQDSIKTLPERFPSGPTKKSFFQHSLNTPIAENLKKLNLLTAVVYIYNNVDKFSEDNLATVAQIKTNCLELFEQMCYCAYKFKLFETSLARGGNFEVDVDAVEFASNVSWVV